MDEPNKSDNPAADTENQPSSSDGVSIPVNSSKSGAASDTHSPEGITPPAPGQVVSAGMPQRPAAPATDGTTPPQAPAADMPHPGTPGSPGTPGTPDSPATTPPPKVVTSGGRGKRWLKVLLLLIIIALLAAGGYIAYHKNHKTQQAPAASQSKVIPLLKIGVTQASFGDTLYPDISINEYSYLTNAQMFEGLVRYEDKSKIVPNLASTWTNPDSKTWLFTIRDGVKFHDGHTLTASDVKYSLDKVIASNSDLAQTYGNTIASVDLVGKNQVKITTKDADPVLLNRLAFLYVIDANLPKGQEPSQAGTGPYEVKPGTKPTDTNIQMVAFDQYHGGVPKTKALDFGANNDANQLVKAYNNHQYDIVGPIPLADVPQAKNPIKFITRESDVRFIGFNTTKGPFQNKLVREAVRYAVDPTAIGKAAGDQVTPAGQLIPESIPGYNPAIKPYKQDINKAKQLLTQAGYPNGLTVRFSVTGDQNQINEMAKELKQAGITAQLDSHADLDEFINYFSAGQADMYTIDYVSDTLDGLDIYSSVLSDANYNNPQLTQLLDQANTTTDPAKRLKLLQDAANIINQDVPVVPLSSANDIWLMDKDYAIQQDMPSSLISVYFSKTHLK